MLEQNTMERDTTESLCPVCLDRIAARRVSCGDRVQLVKNCPAHGEFRTVIWRGRPAMRQWRRPKTPILLHPVQHERLRGCPFDCGLCPDHRQRSCTVLFEVTRRCNLNCPVCFAASGPGPDNDPVPAEIRTWFRAVQQVAAGSNIQLSGGEPTLRNDLPEIVAAGREAGFAFIQLNTNGIRLGRDGGYLKALKDAGLASVFLQFDGIDDEVHQNLRGAALLEVKQRAIEACGRHGIGVVLVPTLVPGVNTGQIGSLLRFAASRSPVVRGIHFQPVSYFGRCLQPPTDASRITLPELMAAIEHQSEGMFRAADFRPPGCENAWCSFHADYLTLPGGGVRHLQQAQPSDCCKPIPAQEGALRTMARVSRQWAGPRDDTATGPGTASGDPACGLGAPDDGPMPLEDFLDRARTHTLTVSAMAFQDAWTLDLERLRDCCIHVWDARYGLVPFCAYNVTSADGRGLYRK
jgi:uncharacterized radical SAM superfamily Fe-S cluster-containing enzyme